MAAIELTDPPLDPSNDPLWHRIDAMDFDSLGAAYPFSVRLAAENGWTPQYAERVVEEYKRFCYLAVRTNHAVVPSDQIDQAWHLHLSFSRAYWNDFCAKVLGTDLHHSPANSGDPEDAAFHQNHYAKTLDSYERLSGERPPPDIWPNAEALFSDNLAMRRVNSADYLIIRKPPKGVLWAIQIALVFTTLFCLWEGEYMAAAGVGFAAVALAVYRDRTDNIWKTKPWRDGDDGGVGTGGCSSRGI